jgi:hypothetical protein
LLSLIAFLTLLLPTASAWNVTYVAKKISEKEYTGDLPQKVERRGRKATQKLLAELEGMPGEFTTIFDALYAMYQPVKPTGCLPREPIDDAEIAEAYAHLAAVGHRKFFISTLASSITFSPWALMQRRLKGGGT